MVVKRIMSSKVITVSPETTLKEVGELLKRERINGLPVVDASSNVVGIITLTDILRILNGVYKWKELEKSQPGLELSSLFEKEKQGAKVGDFMSKRVYILGEDDSIEEVMRLMFTKSVHTIPVAKDGKLVGVVGRHDLISACF